MLAAAPGEGKGGARRRLGEVECGRNGGGGGGGDCEEEKGDKDGSGRNDLHARGLAEIVMYVSSYSFSGDSRLRSSREEESESGRSQAQRLRFEECSVVRSSRVWDERPIGTGANYRRK